MRAWRAVLGAVLVAALASCRPTAEAIAEGDDPLAALGAPVASRRYDGPFWAREAHGHSLVWQRARALCAERADEDLPSCRIVGIVARWEGPPSLPALRVPRPPVLSPGAPGYVGADVRALEEWERELAMGKRSAGSGAVR